MANVPARVFATYLFFTCDDLVTDYPSQMVTYYTYLGHSAEKRSNIIPSLIRLKSPYLFLQSVVDPSQMYDTRFL